MENYVKVKDADMIRDIRNNALINQNKNELDNYLIQSKRIMQQKEEINSIKTEVSSLKDDVGEIKELLLQLVKDK